MMFEVQDLAVASPATVSRCGMVYLEPNILGLKPFVNCWMLKLPDCIFDHRDKLASLFDSFLEVGNRGYLHLKSWKPPGLGLCFTNVSLAVRAYIVRSWPNDQTLFVKHLSSIVWTFGHVTEGFLTRKNKQNLLHDIFEKVQKHCLLDASKKYLTSTVLRRSQTVKHFAW